MTTNISTSTQHSPNADEAATLHFATRKQAVTDTPRARALQAALTRAFAPTHLAVLNESHKHAGPAAESHFRVVVVSTAFEGKTLIARHRLINEAAAAEFAAGLHALAIEAYTPAQWISRNAEHEASPACMGGSKHA